MDSLELSKCISKKSHDLDNAFLPADGCAIQTQWEEEEEKEASPPHYFKHGPTTSFQIA